MADVQGESKSIGDGCQNGQYGSVPCGPYDLGLRTDSRVRFRKVAERLKNVPPEAIIQPELNIIASPALEALRYTEHRGVMAFL